MKKKDIPEPDPVPESEPLPIRNTVKKPTGPSRASHVRGPSAL